jgi:hypothetical protein
MNVRERTLATATPSEAGIAPESVRLRWMPQPTGNAGRQGGCPSAAIDAGRRRGVKRVDSFHTVFKAFS